MLRRTLRVYLRLQAYLFLTTFALALWAWWRWGVEPWRLPELLR